jgi:hypothetical protein
MINYDVTNSIIPCYLNILNKLGHLKIGKECTIKGITILPSGSMLALVRIDNGSERVDVPLEKLLPNIASIDTDHRDYKFVKLALDDIEKSIVEVRSQVASSDPEEAAQSRGLFASIKQSALSALSAIRSRL